jgi:hypothetical protein
MTEMLEAETTNKESSHKDSLDIEMEFDSRVCYALSHNKRPPIRKVTIRNNDGRLRGPAKVTITSEWTASTRPPIREIEKVVDLRDSGHTTEIEFRDSRLDDIAMAYLDERAPADVIVSIIDEQGVSVSKRFELTVLARNQWKSDLFELTAAFVQSQHPEVKRIISDASDLLKQRGMGGAIAGNQVGPEQKLQLAKAIFDAMSTRINSYITSPPSIDFMEQGQQVRPLDQILESKGGNCIELACAYSACLLEAGLSPVIFLLHGHAFAGFYVNPENSANRWDLSLTSNFSSISNLMDRKMVVPVETTAIPEETTFEEAILDTQKHFVERTPETCSTCQRLVNDGEPKEFRPHMEAVVDVLRALAEGVNPIPARSLDENGQEVLVIYSPNGNAPIIERRDPVTHRVLPETVPARIQRWKNLLLDLSKRSPLISFEPSVKGIELVSPEDHLGAIEDYLLDGGSIKVPGVDDMNRVLKQTGVEHVQKIHGDDLLTNWTSGHVIFGFANTSKGHKEKTDTPSDVTVEKRASELNTKARSGEQDSGVNNLHLALGMVTWPHNGIKPGAESGIEMVTSPLFLVPIRMTLPRGKSVPTIALAPDSMSTVNYSLLESLRSKLNLQLEWFNEDMSDDSGLDIDRGLDELRKELLTSGLADKGVRVEARAAIGVFPFNKIRLWKDLNDHWSDFIENPVVKHMVEVGTGNFHDPADPEDLGISLFTDTTLLNPQPADGAQTRAIVKALDGQSFVLEGPPGTGKSQTITNLLANALSRGMKVLFVAEKPEARSVVRERLQAVGLDPFCLDMHDQGSKPEMIKEQIRDALDFTPVDVEERWEKMDEAFQVISEALSSYRNRVHGLTSAGRSYFDSYEMLLELGQDPKADIGRALVSEPADRISEIRQLLLGLRDFAEPAQVQPHNPWGFVGIRDFSSIERRVLAEKIADVLSTSKSMQSMRGPWETAIQQATTWTEFRSVAAALELEDQGGLPSNSEWRAIAKSDWQAAAATGISALEKALGSWEELSVGSSNDYLTRDFDAQSAAITTAANSFVIGRKKKITLALGDLVSLPVFTELSPANVTSRFASLHEFARTYQSSIKKLKALEGMRIRLLESTCDLGSIQALKDRFERLDLVAQIINDDTEFARSLTAAMADPQRVPDFQPLSDQVFALKEIFTLLKADETLIAEWHGSQSFLLALNKSAPTWDKGRDDAVFIALSRWITLLNHLAPLESDPYKAFRLQLMNDSIHADEAANAFERAILNAVLLVVGEENRFDVFDQSNQDRLVGKFVDLIKQRESLLRDLIPARLYQSRKFDANSNIGTVGNLRTELSSKRRGARSVRDLIVKYPEIISELTPCFLMGPDSVAKFVPPGSIKFDLVVFDEASQIRVEDAIGAMGRSQAVVIVGDSRQMPPSSAFSSKLAFLEDDDLDVEDFSALPQDAESILEEAVESGLPRELLTWHYRSRDEILIDFSNRSYYEGRLGSFPSPFINRLGVGIEYHRVDGQFNHQLAVTKENKDYVSARGLVQTNPIEADAIVAEVVRRVNDLAHSDDTLGVITLNLNQTKLITKKLQDTEDPEVIRLLDSNDPNRRLFVHNLERVQGRERDVIIFGTSFSNRYGTSNLPLQFGPLTNKGGERRLNVAITRARKQMVIYSSFDPVQLGAASSEGLKDLGQYLAEAQNTSGNQNEPKADTSAESDLYTMEVAEALRETGLKVQVGYGLSHFKVDLAVGSPEISDRWLVGLLLDGRDWGRRDLALDRDALPLTVLNALMGWPAVARVWLPAWKRDKTEVVDTIAELVALLARGESQLPVTITDALEVELEKVAVTAPRIIANSTNERLIAYTKWNNFRFLGFPESMDSKFKDVKAILVEIAQTEGPIPAESALKIAAKCFDITRLTTVRLERLIPILPTKITIKTKFGAFLFPLTLIDDNGEVSTDYKTYRATTPGTRKITEIAPHETANAIVHIVEKSHSIDKEELAQELLTAFGYTRKTQDALDEARGRVMWAIDNDYVSVSGATVKPTNKKPTN